MNVWRLFFCLIVVGIFDAQARAGDAATSGLSVASAWYGFNKRLDVTSRVKEMCDGKAACELPASNDFFGSDPEPGIKKELHIKWTCSPSPEAKDAMKVEGTTLRLSCP
jgi:hypothetical protein